MRALAASPLGLLIGLSMGALGGGGSILAVPVLVYIAAQSPRAATTITLVVVALAALVGSVDHWRSGRVRAGPGVVFGLAGVGGSLAGSALNRRLDPDLLLLAFAGLVVVAAWRMLSGCPSCTKVGEQSAIDSAGRTAVLVGLRVDVVTVGKVLGSGTVVGLFTGLFGVGGGFIIVPALTLGLRFAMPDAIGTSLLIIAINWVVALAARLGSSGIEWAVTVPFAVSAMAGTLVGSRLADRLPARTTLRWFAGLLIAVAAYTAVRSLVTLTGSGGS